MRKAADTIKQLDIPIDGIVGFPTVTAAPWELTSDGIESHFERNYLCYFVLVNLLLEKMSVGSRVVMVTTSVRQDADAPMWRDVNFSVSPFILAYLDTYTFSFFAEWRYLSSTGWIRAVDVCKYCIRKGVGTSIHCCLFC